MIQSSFASLKHTVSQCSKAAGVGSIECELHVGISGALFVRMAKNTQSGTLSGLAFNLAYLRQRLKNSGSTFIGFSEDGTITEVRDNNNKAFLRVVVEQLLPPEK